MKMQITTHIILPNYYLYHKFVLVHYYVLMSFYVLYTVNLLAFNIDFINIHW